MSSEIPSNPVNQEKAADLLRKSKGTPVRQQKKGISSLAGNFEVE